MEIDKNRLEILKKEYEVFKKDNSNLFLLKYTKEKEELLFLSKIIKEIDGQVCIVCSSISKLKTSFKELSRYLEKEKISTIHKTLSKNKILKEYKEIANGSKKLILGTKTSIFSPFHNLKTIIVKDENDIDHKQYDSNPRYNAKDICLFLSKKENIKLIYTSKSPSVDFYYQNPKIINIEDNQSNLNISIIDKNTEKTKENYAISFQLEELLKEESKKIIIINNNKKFANGIICKNCKFIQKCSKCKSTIKYNKKENVGECTKCDNKENVIKACPKCAGYEINFYGLGNEKLEEELINKFNIKKDVISIIDAEHPIDSKSIKTKRVLIGTEFLSKNYLSEIDNINAICLLSVDTYIDKSDFNSNEYLFSYIRDFVSISEEKSVNTLIIETKYPKNKILHYAIDNDYNKFYQEEIETRKALDYPPISKIVKLIIKNDNIKNISKIEKILEKNNIELLGKLDKIKQDDRRIVNILIKLNNNDTIKELSNLCLLDINPENLIK